ncbi:MAG: methionyl-tRNA formyltransferase [Endozoicomonadaceae bacterium]|nr:methionyl-tRNA formyltransferase [Endozoicomonadaceae bacterium]MBE8233376.1 methionyl-tRNA formyltransferase [Endozoicomonadaceae bacterium]
MALRILFAGTPDFALWHLMPLFSNAHVDLVGILTQPDKPSGRGRMLQASPVKQFALEKSLWIQQPTSLKNPDIQSLLATLKLDLIIVVAYGLLLPQAILDVPRYGCINVHASLLPAWRGAAPVQHAILNQNKKTGVTLMQMDAGLDSGDILWASDLRIEVEDTTNTLLNRLAQLGVIGLSYVIEQLMQGHLLPKQVQDETQVTYAPKIKKSDGLIQWHDSAQHIQAQIAALNPWPIAWFELGSDRIRCWKATCYPETTRSYPGQLLGLDKKALYVACGDGGIVSIHYMQWPGKRVISAADLMNQQPLPFVIGMQL